MQKSKIRSKYTDLKKKKKNSDSLKGNQHSFTYDSINLEVPICYLKKQKTPQALYSV